MAFSIRGAISAIRNFISPPRPATPPKPSYNVPAPSYSSSRSSTSYSPSITSNSPYGTQTSTPAYRGSSGGYYNTSGQKVSSYNTSPNLVKSVAGIAKNIAGGVSSGLSSVSGTSLVGGLPFLSFGAGGGTQGYEEAPAPKSNQSYTSYGGKPATETLLSTTGSPSSMPKAGSSSISYEQRAENQDFLKQAEASRQALVASTQEKLKSVQDALATAMNTQNEVYDPDQEENIKQLQAERDQALKDLEDAQKITPEEEDVRRQEDALTAEEAKIKANLKSAETELGNQPIPYAFISGQKAYAQNRANADLENIAAERVPLTQKLATLQARRQAASDVVKSRLAAAGSKLDRGYTTYDKRFDASVSRRKEDQENYKPFSLSSGESRYVYNPVTKKYEMVSSVAAQPKISYDTVTINEGGVPVIYRVGFDEQGREVSRVKVGTQYYKPSEGGNDNASIDALIKSVTGA